MDHSSGFGCVMIDAVRPARQEYGALAQLGERLLCKQDVVGSIPSGSTTKHPFGSELWIAVKRRSGSDPERSV